MYNIENCNNYDVKHKTPFEQIKSKIKNKCYTNKIIEKTDQKLRCLASEMACIPWTHEFEQSV